jgi:hypothetical protein
MVAQAAHRSGGRCECDGKCGTVHDDGRCDAVNGLPHPVTGSVVVLTLAHEHGVPLEETSIERMFHACQRCHNRYDAPMRAAGVKARREAERRRVLDKAGQLAFEVECAQGRRVDRASRRGRAGAPERQGPTQK